jgi:hypothetical protein
MSIKCQKEVRIVTILSRANITHMKPKQEICIQPDIVSSYTVAMYNKYDAGSNIPPGRLLLLLLLLLLLTILIYL